MTPEPPNPLWVIARRWVANSDRRAIAFTVALYVVFAANFGAYRVVGDGVDYFSFVQRLFGDRSDASGYNFGVGLLNSPAYGVAKVAAAVVPRLDSADIGQASITVSSIGFVVATALASAWLLGRLGLGHRALAVGGAVFGTPVWYYGSLSPAYAHAADAAVFAAVAACTVLLVARDDRRFAGLLGAALGLAVAVRPFNAGLVLGACIALVACRRWRDALVVGVASVTTFAVLAAIPLLLGADLNERADGSIVGSPDDTAVAERTVFGFAPLSPIRMLVSPHRGLLVWTPVTIASLVGVVVHLRRRRMPDAVLLLAAMFIGLLLMHVALEYWDGGWSFSMRLLAAPVALYAIGIAALLDSVHGRAQALVRGAVVVAGLWSVFLGMNHAFGASQDDGAFEIAGRVISRERSLGDLVDLTWSYSRIRHVVEAIM